MQHPSLLASSATFTISPAHFCRISVSPFRSIRGSAIASSMLQFRCLSFSKHPPSTLTCSTTEVRPVGETRGNKDEPGFIEIGYITNVHGLQGELRVRPTTDFPELRFSTPGKRWLRARIAGEERIQEVELTEGRGHLGQKAWIISLKGLDTLEKARQVVGATLLIRESDRPVLEEGDFYIPDLVGMKVILKETGETVGTVVDVFNSGASDLLQVRLQSTKANDDVPKIDEVTPGALVWVPFVEAIVPDVDMNNREMHITPPEGLLKLNLRSDARSKKERRQEEWKQRKKLQQRVIVAKRKLSAMGQQHILQGLSFGEDAQKAALANDIVSINFKLLQRAMHSFNAPLRRPGWTDFLHTNWAKLSKNAMRMSKESFISCRSNLKVDTNYKKGVDLLSRGTAAIILMLANKNDWEPCSKESLDLSHLQAFLQDHMWFAKGEELRMQIPLVVVCASRVVQSCQQLFLDNCNFNFDADKVWFSEEEKLPVVGSSVAEGNTCKILLDSPWKILQSPIGSGGVISLMSSHGIMKTFSDMGIEYVEICNSTKRSAAGNPFFFGLIDSRQANVVVKTLDEEEDDNMVDMIFSMKFLEKITEKTDKFEFFPMPKISSYVEKREMEWVDVIGTSPNSYLLHCPIHNFLNVCPPDKICLVQIVGCNQGVR